MASYSIRSESPEDVPSIRGVHLAAFGQPDEADLVDRLRLNGAVLLSLVAESDGAAVGHILFSRLLIELADEPIEAVALAPVAVLPDRQGEGVGGELIRRGLAELSQRGEKIVVVLGAPAYYQRFGFSSDRAQRLESPFPPDSLMAIELAPGALTGVRGRLRYADAFGL